MQPLGRLASIIALLSIVANLSLAESPRANDPTENLHNADDGFEAPPVLSASSLLAPGECAGPSHRVREQVPTDGYMAHFTIDSDYGTFVCAGIEQTRERIHEVYAIHSLIEVSRSDLFADGLRRSIEQPIDAVKNIAKDPVRTVKAVPKTVGHFFKKVTTSVKSVASSINDKNSGTGELSIRDSARDIGKGLASAGKGIAGFNSAKLECAKQLGVDPYADNDRLQEELEKVSWVFFAGGLPLKIGTAVASGGASQALTATKLIGLPDEIYALTPNELDLRNQQAMTAMQVSAEVQKAFTQNPALSLSLRSSMLRSLEQLSGATGKPAIVELAADCATRQQARFLEQSVRMLAGKGGKVSEIRVFGRLLAAVDSNGALLLPAPVDYVSWTSEVAELTKRDDLSGLHPTILMPGSVSAHASKELKSLGWISQSPGR